MNNKKKKIAIIGHGRFGKLLAEMLLPFGEIMVVTSQENIDENFTKIDYSDLGAADWVIPSVPISTLEEVLQKINKIIKKGALVIDVCSVKVLPCKWLRENISEDIEIIGTHPMFGPDSAKNGFSGLQIVLCPLRISEENLDEMRNIFGKLELRITETTPEEHDRQVAKSLGLVHFLGRGLNRLGVGKQEISTVGFERLLAVNETVNNDTWQLFLDMHQYNPYTSEVREEFIAKLKQLNNEINEGGSYE